MPHIVSLAPPLHRPFKQQPFAQFPALHKSEPLLLAELLLLELDEPFELLLAELLELLVFVVPDVDELLELLAFALPPEPPVSLPFPPPVVCSNSPPVAQAKMTKGHIRIKLSFFILAPRGLRRY